MDQKLAADILIGDSDEILDLKANLDQLEGFIGLIRELDALPEIKKRFYEDSRSLYQITVIGQNIDGMEKLLSTFFGDAVKPAGKGLPRKQRKSSVVKYLGGIQKDQSLFSVDLKTGTFYGALWPWRRNKSKIEVHLGYCSDWMTDDDYQKLQTFVHQAVSHGTFAHMDTNIGGSIHGISLPSFLQMAEMEKSSFTLRVTSRQRIGELHLSDGNLIAADLDDISGSSAAYHIISWDDASIDIKPLNESKAQEINLPLMHILMESLKQKDEAISNKEKPPPQLRGRPKAKERPDKKPPEKKGAPAKRLVRLERVKGPSSPEKKRSLFPIIGIGIGALVVVAVIAVAVFHIMEDRRTSDDYQVLINQIEKMPSLEQQKARLKKYFEEHPISAYGPDIQNRIRDIDLKIEDRDLDQVTLKVSDLPLDEHYESKAIEIYSKFLEKYPNSRHTDKINQSIAEIKNLLDQYYYEELKRAARLDFNKRLQAYRQYISQFPEGKYREDVQILINEMGEKYLNYLHDEAEQCEKNRRYDSCIEHCENFIAAYTGLELSKKAIKLKTQLEDKRSYSQLFSKALEAGNDFRKVHQLYKTYLEQNPNTTQRKKIEEELAKLSKKIKEQRQWLDVKKFANNSAYDLYTRIQKLDRYISKNINGVYAGDAQSLMEKLEYERQVSLKRQKIKAKKETEKARIERQLQEEALRKKRVKQLQEKIAAELSGSKRYQANGDGTFTDLTTGLTWAIVDSFQELGGCMTYKDATKYINNLRHGGHRAWRLPTAYELAGINKKPPYFPVSGANWYWSSETSVKGYHSVADVVTATHESVFKRGQRALTECGSVRAILIP